MDMWALHMQLDVSLVEQDWRWHCERNFKLTLGDGVVDLFFIDTNPGISEYQTAAFANHTGRLSSNLQAGLDNRQAAMHVQV